MTRTQWCTTSGAHKTGSMSSVQKYPSALFVGENGVQLRLRAAPQASRAPKDARPIARPHFTSPRLASPRLLEAATEGASCKKYQSTEFARETTEFGRSLRRISCLTRAR